MKKLASIVAFLLCLILLCSCGSSSGRPKTPEAAIERFVEALREGDIEEACFIAGIDYRETIKASERSRYRSLEEFKSKYPRFFSESDPSYNEWVDRLSAVSTWDEAIAFAIDFDKADSFASNPNRRAALVEKLENELKGGKSRELSGWDEENAFEKLEDYLHRRSDRYLFSFSAQDVEKTYYFDSNGKEFLIVQTDQGCIFVDTFYYVDSAMSIYK